MSLDLKKVAAFIRTASTEDLMDRVTVYREGMEPAAVDLMENELWRRGLTPEEVADHAATRGQVVRRSDGSAVRCTYCDRPAASARWGWHRLFGLIPVFPRPLPRCDQHGG
jgi:hypothetical protein